MAEVNLDRLRQLAAEIRRAVHRLRALGTATEGDFLADANAVNSAKYLFVVACEAAIDICGHLAARRGGRAPEDYADCFQVLEEMGILDVELSHRLARMARFRNLLVHLYWKIDDARVYQAIHHGLGDYEQYLRAIARYLSDELEPQPWPRPISNFATVVSGYRSNNDNWLQPSSSGIVSGTSARA